MGTSSMPLGRMRGSITPSSRGNQSAWLRRVSCRRTSASVRTTPTLNCTVSTARPGYEADMTCSVPAICESICSEGMASICSTSATEAPGKGSNTLAMVTLICGSSSRGVAMTANTPSRNATRASSGVICALWNRAAMRPAKPRDWADRALSFMPCCPPCQRCLAAACGSAATWSPARRPLSTSTLSPLRRPSRTWRSSGRPAGLMA